MTHFLSEPTFTFVICVLAFTSDILYGEMFYKSKCKIPSQSYVDDYEVIAEGPTLTLIECSLKSIVLGCEGFFLSYTKLMCVCAIVHESSEPPSEKNMTLIDDLKSSLGNKKTSTKYYEVSSAEPCRLSNYVRIPGLDGCVRIGRTTMKYNEAETSCQTDGTHLLSVSTKKKSRALHRYLVCNGHTKAYWLGLNDVATEGTYTWLDGSPMNYTNWAPNEPANSRTDQDCVRMKYDSIEKQFYWMIARCIFLFYDLCGEL